MSMGQNTIYSISDVAKIECLSFDESFSVF